MSLIFLSYLNLLNRLTTHLSTNNLLNSYQSAYTKHHTTESTHDHIIKSMSEQKVTALCLLDLSAAFDTIDHSILLHRLSSWFGFVGTVISLVTSYLSSRSFVVSINSTSSASSPLRQCVPHESVLWPLLFILYTTPLSSFISWFVCRPSCICWWHSIVHFLPGTWILRQYSTPTKYNWSLNGCLLIFSHSINLKLSFFLLAYLLSYLKSLILLF